MGSAILHGILDSITSDAHSVRSESTKHPITRFIACTKTAESAERLKATFPVEQKSLVEVTPSQEVPVEIMKRADVIILGFKPFMAEDVLGSAGVRDALAGKLVISLLAGQTPHDLIRIIRKSSSGSFADPVVVQVNPNMGARFRESMTMIGIPEEPIPAQMKEVVDWVFNQVGAIKYLPPNQMNLGSVVGGAALAIMTVPIEGILDGCVAEGLRRPEAMELVLQGIRGLSAALESGIHPAVLRESVSSPRGCTIQSLLSLERAGSRADYADAVIQGTQHLKTMNK